MNELYSTPSPRHMYVCRYTLRVLVFYIIMMILSGSTDGDLYHRYTRFCCCFSSHRLLRSVSPAVISELLYSQGNLSAIALLTVSQKAFIKHCTPLSHKEDYDDELEDLYRMEEWSRSVGRLPCLPSLSNQPKYSKRLQPWLWVIRGTSFVLYLCMYVYRS